MVILAGKIGANTDLALYTHELDRQQNKYIMVEKIGNISFPTPNSVEDLKNKIKQFLTEQNYYDAEGNYIKKQDSNELILGASFGIEGPILDNGEKTRVKRDNLDITFSRDDLREILPISALPIDFRNDMVHIGNALLLEKNIDKSAIIYNEEKKLDPKTRKCLMLVGDGLGQSLWQWAESQKSLFPTSSEGGHCRFAPQTQKEWDLCLFIKEEIKGELIKIVENIQSQKELEKKENIQLKELLEQELIASENLDEIKTKLIEKLKNLNLDKIKVRFENVLSRSGLINIYKFLINTDYKQQEESSDLKELLLNEKENKVKIVQKIIEKATQLDNQDLLCIDVLNMFMTIWGARVGDLGISYESKEIYTGGVFIPLEKFNEGIFQGAFLEKNIFNSRNYNNNENILISVFKEKVEKENIKEDIVIYGAVCYAIKADYINRGKLTYAQRRR